MRGRWSQKFIISGVLQLKHKKCTRCLVPKRGARVYSFNWVEKIFMQDSLGLEIPVSLEIKLRNS